MMQDDNRPFAAGASLEALHKRAVLRRRLRAFFEDRGFVEVETPLLSDEVIPELHIEPMTVEAEGDSPLFLKSADTKGAAIAREKGTVPGIAYLQASPELHMKRLLAAGAKAIFQVTRSFRGGERGRLHHPEFTIVEWYRAGDDMTAGIELLDELAQTLLGTPPAARTTYADAFQRCVGLCPHTATIEELAAAADEFPSPLWGGVRGGERDERLNLILAKHVEPQLGRDRPEIVYHYPATQASLARVVAAGIGYEVAERFELYWRGVELANGFHELTDAGELRVRFDAVNDARIAAGRPALPLPKKLLAAMEHGLPDCAGCALGFDRLVMLAIGARSIEEGMAFPNKRV